MTVPRAPGRAGSVLRRRRGPARPGSPPGDARLRSRLHRRRWIKPTGRTRAAPTSPPTARHCPGVALPDAARHRGSAGPRIAASVPRRCIERGASTGPAPPGVHLARRGSQPLQHPLDREHDQVLGAIALRHELTEPPRHAGGHIGYGIRASARRRGLATWAVGHSGTRALGPGAARQRSRQHRVGANDGGSRRTGRRPGLGGRPEADGECNGSVKKAQRSVPSSVMGTTLASDHSLEEEAWLRSNPLHGLPAA